MYFNEAAAKNAVEVGLSSHVEAQGGNVMGATTLLGARYAPILAPRARTLAAVRA